VVFTPIFYAFYIALDTAVVAIARGDTAIATENDSSGSSRSRV
jgi:hypothetical protein